eukprot:TRINITY_DN32144_c0_g1_i1.p1 TRINITY_DN32144_c0_g1~~TRINITY_DN32144_c0_g1_i1.p1  ORF type:complete len:981 (+),score=419.58 TRINITY_DN32144_c0_g1_i1:65-2944(+)
MLRHAPLQSACRATRRGVRGIHAGPERGQVTVATRPAEEASSSGGAPEKAPLSAASLGQAMRQKAQVVLQGVAYEQRQAARQWRRCFATAGVVAGAFGARGVGAAPSSSSPTDFLVNSRGKVGPPKKDGASDAAEGEGDGEGAEKQEKKSGAEASKKASAKETKKGGGNGGGDEDPENDGNDGKNNGNQSWSASGKPQAIFLLSTASLLVWWLMYSNRNATPDKEISWQVFRDQLYPSGKVEKVKIINGARRAVVKVYLADAGYAYWFTVASLETFEQSLAELERSLNVPPSQGVKVLYDNRIELADLAPMLGWLLWVVVLFQTARVSEAMPSSMINQQKGKFKPVIGARTRFKDVAGMKEPKKEITEFVDFMKFPQRFTKLGAKVPSGAILFGPPGTGKTLLAKAVAGESGVPFFSVCGADFVEMYVGVGASRVRELFKAARKHPRAIIYIDEIDAVGRKRGGSLFSGGSSERENTLNQLLIEMDGFKKNAGNIIVLASTNVSPSSLDEALLRPGRLDRQVFIDRPTIKEREEIFETHLNTINLVPSAKFNNKEIKGKDALQVDNEKREALGLPPLNSNGEVAASSTPTTKAAAAAEDDAEASDGEKDAKAEAEAEAPRIHKVNPDTFWKTAAGSRKPKPFISENRRHRLRLQQRAQKTEDGTKEAFNKAILPNSPVVKTKISRRMAQLSPGFVGADIANICNEGALIAARDKRAFVDLECMEKAIDRVIGGIEKRSRVMSDFEKRAVAYHEAGHAIVGWFLEHCDPLMKISIVPRGSAALGYAQYLPSEKQMRTYQQILDSMCMTLGGRASELFHFKHLSTGAQDDLSKVTRSAYTAVATFGMARHRLGGVVSYPAPGTSDTNIMRPYSDDMAAIIDEEAKKLVDHAFDRTMQLIKDKEVEIKKVAEHLLKHEVITRQDFIDLIGPRPFEEDEIKHAGMHEDNEDDEVIKKPDPSLC